MLEPPLTFHELDCAGRSCFGSRAPGHERFLIGHLGKTMLVSKSNTRFESETRVSGPSQGHVLVVADGIGSPSAGARAAETAIETIARQLLGSLPWFSRLDIALEGHLERQLQTLVARCRSDAAASVGSARDGERDTSITAAYVLWPRMYVVHVGDGRAYVARGRSVREVTRAGDRRRPARSPDAGARPAHAEDAAARTEPTSAVSRVELEPGDRALLCTRGLTESLERSRIERVLAGDGSADETVEALMRESAEGDWRDDRTAVVACFRSIA